MRDPIEVDQSGAPRSPAAAIRVGLLGLDSSHCVEFTKLFNDAAHPNHVPGARVTVAFRGGSADMPEKSLRRIDGFARTLTERHAVSLCESIDDVVAQCDAVMIESVDGRKHLEIARRVFPTGKPVFIDKPLAGTLAQGLEIARLAAHHRTTFFSASSLRFAAAVSKLPPGVRLDIREAATHSPCDLEPHHPDLFWYGVHGVELLYALLGAGCATVSRVHTPQSDVVTGRWSDGRTGVFHGHRGLPAAFGFIATTRNGVVSAECGADYAPLLQQVVEFFRTHQPPVCIDEMIEVLAFMEAADESKRRGGASVALAEMMAKHA